jgi:hypothetical protein
MAVRKTQAGLDLKRWFKEKWVNVRKKENGKYASCGTSEKGKYAYCRPSKKINESTPVTVKEAGDKLKSKIREKASLSNGKTQTPQKVSPMKRTQKYQSGRILQNDRLPDINNNNETPGIKYRNIADNKSMDIKGNGKQIPSNNIWGKYIKPIIDEAGDTLNNGIKEFQKSGNGILDNVNGTLFPTDTENINKNVARTNAKTVFNTNTFKNKFGDKGVEFNDLNKVHGNHMNAIYDINKKLQNPNLKDQEKEELQRQLKDHKSRTALYKNKGASMIATGQAKNLDALEYNFGFGTGNKSLHTGVPFNIKGTRYDSYKEGGKTKDWLKNAVNPSHKGDCTPLSNPKCTGHKKQFALMMKKNHGFHKSSGFRKASEGMQLTRLQYPPQMNIIPRGVLHSQNNQIGDKGMPIIDFKGNKKAEIEKNELITTREVTKEIENLVNKYNIDKDPETLRKLGHFTYHQILNNTVDKSGAFKKLKQDLENEIL